MLRIGLTGGIGSGKSTITRLFSDLGVPVIDADQVSRELVQPGQPALTQIVTLFGQGILTPEGTLDRGRLRECIFAEPMLRDQLEAILHPLIRQQILEHLSKFDSPYAILAIPLLIETGWQSLVDRILVIDCDTESQIVRTMQRDHVSRQQVEAILASQAKRETRLREADEIIDNSGDLAHLQWQVLALHQRYLSLSTAKKAE